MANPQGGRQIVLTPGIARALSDTPRFVQRVDIQAMRGNTVPVLVGGPDICALTGAENSIELSANESINFQNCDLSQVFIDSTVANEGVKFLVS